MTGSLKDFKKVVIKIGSSSLTHQSGLLDLWKMESLVKQIANLYNSGKDIVIVSSGAIAAGMGKMKFIDKPKTIPEKQAAAAVGQGTLMYMYEKLFSEYGITVAQVLLTKEDMYQEVRREHSINAFSALIKHRIIPIVNENDVVAIDEIKVGDNDTLSAEVCKMIGFENLTILSDIEGVYNKDPRKYKNAYMIDEIKSIAELDEIEAGDAGSNVGTGGMQTKLKAAQIIAQAKGTMLIVNSGHHEILNELLIGRKCGTFFDFRN
jgi:glutamate 5-kinase